MKIRSTHLALIAIGTSFNSMAHQFVLAGYMIDLSGEEVISQCMTLGPFLLGQGLGSWYGQNIQVQNKLNKLFSFEWMTASIAIVLPLIIPLIITVFLATTNKLYTPQSELPLSLLFSIAIPISIMLGFLTGVQLPLLIKETEKSEIEKLLFLNYLGSLLAGLFLSQLQQASIGLRGQALAVSCFNLITMVLVLRYLIRPWVKVIRFLIPIAGLCLLIFGGGFVENISLKTFYFGLKLNSWNKKEIQSFVKTANQYGTVERYQSPYQTIDFVIEDPVRASIFPGNFTLYLNRKDQLDLFTYQSYHETMVHGPINLNRVIPKTVLILGAGDGLLLNELQKLKEIESITQVEIDPLMIKLTETHPFLSSLAKDVYSKKKSQTTIIIGDAIHFLRNTNYKYDAIYLDLPFPIGLDLFKLYSVEFYQMVRKHLSTKGFIAFDLPINWTYKSGKRTLSNLSEQILTTVYAAGFQSVYPFGSHMSFVFATPDKRILNFDYDLLPTNLGLSTSLNLVGINYALPLKIKHPENVLSMFWPRYKK